MEEADGGIQDRNIWVIGAAGEAEKSLYIVDQNGPDAWVLKATACAA